MYHDVNFLTSCPTCIAALINMVHMAFLRVRLWNTDTEEKKINIVVPILSFLYTDFIFS